MEFKKSDSVYYFGSLKTDKPIKTRITRVARTRYDEPIYYLATKHAPPWGIRGHSWQLKKAKNKKHAQHALTKD